MANTWMAWEDEYCLGLEAIDEQHKSLVSLINDIWQSIVEKSANTQVFALINELETYTLAHFAAEETYMQTTRYPDFARHRDEHQEFVARISAEKSKAMVTGQLSLDLTYYLRDWLVQHILISDKQYAEYSQRSAKEDSPLIVRLFRRFF